MLHGSETWPVRKENEVALQHAEMRMVRWMCNVKVKDRVPSKELRERPGIDDIILILQQNRLRWYGLVLRKEDTDWVKKCMEYEVEGSRPRGRPKRTWREFVVKDCQACNLNRKDARAPLGMGKGGHLPPPGNVQMGICNPSPEFLTVFVVGISRISGVVPTYLRMKNVHDS